MILGNGFKLFRVPATEMDLGQYWEGASFLAGPRRHGIWRTIITNNLTATCCAINSEFSPFAVLKLRCKSLLLGIR